MSKKLHLLAICSRNKRRSLTAEQVFKNHPHIEVRSVGTSPKARRTVTSQDVDWADILFCMEKKHQQLLLQRFPSLNTEKIHVAEIEDCYEFMDSELCSMLSLEIEHLYSGFLRAHQANPN